MFVRVTMLMLALAMGFISSAHAVQLKIDGNRIVVSDRFYGDGDFDAFLQLVNSNPQIRTVLMRNFYGGIQLVTVIGVANFIREKGLSTEVSGACISACAIAFLGGVSRRTAPDANPKGTFVGFHGAYRNGLIAKDWEMTITNALRRLSGGRMNENIIRDAYNLDQNGYVAFYDGRRYRRADGTSIFRCAGNERKKTHDCPGLKGTDAYTQGIYTR